MLDLSDRLHVNEREVAAKVIDGEAIVINLANGIYYSADKLGGFIWPLVARGDSLEDIAKAVCASYDVSLDKARSDLQELAAFLIEEGLATRQNGNAALAEDGLANTDGSLAYEPPRFVKYHDMAELFALDPPLPALRDLPGPGREDGK